MKTCFVINIYWQSIYYRMTTSLMTSDEASSSFYSVVGVVMEVTHYNVDDIKRDNRSSSGVSLHSKL